MGPPGPERDKRIAAKDPLLKKPHLERARVRDPRGDGARDVQRSELDFLSQNVASMVINNARCNCNAGKMLVTSKGWPQREALLEKVRAVLADQAPRKAYYPGAFDRYEHLVEGRAGGRRGVRREAGAEKLPWTLICGLDGRTSERQLFSTEPFCPILSEATLDAADPVAFLEAATKFCNDKLWGTLCAVMMVHPSIEHDAAGAPRSSNSVAELRYGAVGINHWTALVYGMVLRLGARTLRRRSRTFRAGSAGCTTRSCSKGSRRSSCAARW